MTDRERYTRWWVISALGLVLGACTGEEEEAAAVAAANTAPVITGTPTTSANQDAAYSFTPSATDADSDPLLFGVDAKPVWAVFDTATGRLSGTPTAAHVGVHRGIVIHVSDGEAQMLLPAFDLTVVATPAANRPPTITGTPAASVTVGVLYSFTPTASDPDGNALTFAIANRPAWAAFDTGTGRLSGTATSAGTFNNIAISVSDGSVSVALASFGITVTPPPPVNRAPVISGSPPTAATTGVSYAFQPTASDPDGNALTFAIANRPAWAAFDAGTGRLAGTPTSAGTFSNIAISVSDGSASAALPAFAITVTAANAPPTISGSPSTTATAGTAYTFTPTASDPDGNTLTFAITNRPAWAIFNVNTGALQGTPPSAQTNSNIVISVSDGTASAALPAFAITVTAVNAPPTISGTPATTATVGTAYTFTPTASDPNGQTLTFSITNGPSWATFTASTGRLQGTPTSANVGAFNNITISVSDGQASAQLAPFTITVSNPPNRAPTITGTPQSAVMQGTAYVFQPTASDPDGDTLTFTIANTPAWATFDTATGRLSGTPAAQHVGTTSGIAITASDGTLTTALPAFSVSVQALAIGSATLSWLPPTQNTDGSPLTNLAGYKVYWGTQQGTYPNSTTLNNPGLATYVVEGLAPGTYFFVATAINTVGAESAFSGVASKTIQ